MKTQQTVESPPGNGHSEDENSSINTAIASKEFYNLLEDIEDLIKETTSLNGEELEKARTEIKNRIKIIKKSMTGLGITIGQRARKSATYTNHYVHDNPWPIIGLSALSGVLLGYLVTRRS